MNQAKTRRTAWYVLRSRLLRPAALISAGVACALLPARTAGAMDTILGVDVNYNDAVDQPSADSGYGIDVRVGPRFQARPLVAAIQLNAGYHNFTGTVEPSVYRALLGGHLAFGSTVRPGVFSHLGVGFLRYDELVGNERDTHTDLAGDLGLALDFRLARELELGLQGSYNYVAGSDVFEWWQTGARVTFALGG